MSEPPRGRGEKGRKRCPRPYIYSSDIHCSLVGGTCPMEREGDALEWYDELPRYSFCGEIVRVQVEDASQSIMRPRRSTCSILRERGVAPGASPWTIFDCARRVWSHPLLPCSSGAPLIRAVPKDPYPGPETCPSSAGEVSVRVARSCVEEFMAGGALSRGALGYWLMIAAEASGADRCYSGREAEKRRATCPWLCTREVPRRVSFETDGAVVLHMLSCLSTPRFDDESGLLVVESAEERAAYWAGVCLCVWDARVKQMREEMPRTLMEDIRAIAEGLLGTHGSPGKEGGIAPADIEGLPPCLSRIEGILRQDAHLPHNARTAYVIAMSDLNMLDHARQVLMANADIAGSRERKAKTIDLIRSAGSYGNLTCTYMRDRVLREVEGLCPFCFSGVECGGKNPYSRRVVDHVRVRAPGGEHPPAALDAHE